MPILLLCFCLSSNIFAAKDIDSPQFQLTESFGKCYVEGIFAVDFVKLLFDGDGGKPDVTINIISSDLRMKEKKVRLMIRKELILRAQS